MLHAHEVVVSRPALHLSSYHFIVFDPVMICFPQDPAGRVLPSSTTSLLLILQKRLQPSSTYCPTMASTSTAQMDTEGAPLWTPQHPENSQSTLFRHHINSRYSLQLDSYEQLWRWSCDHRAHFWSEVWDWEGVIGEKGAPPYTDEAVPPSSNHPWFPRASLNWAENQLRHAEQYPDDIAILHTAEACPGNEPGVTKITQRGLHELVWRVQLALKAEGVGKGDRVAFWGGTCLEVVVVLLATSSLGGIFSSAAADFGVDGVVERLEQVRTSRNEYVKTAHELNRPCRLDQRSCSSPMESSMGRRQDH